MIEKRLPMICIGSAENGNLPLNKFNHKLWAVLKQVYPKPGKTGYKATECNKQERFY